MPMAKQDTAQDKIKKFLFDQHNFDDQVVDEPEEEAPPPPPSFSEEELAAARQEGYEEGRTKALAEAAASREKEISTQLETINRNISTLFEAEKARAALYEAEAVGLANVIFKQIFPILSEKGGLEDVKEVIRDVIMRQKSCPEIVIEVHENFVADIEKLISGKLQANCPISVKAGINLKPGDCNINWENGGATRNPGAIAETIEKELAQTLADRPRLSDNRETIPPSGEKS